MSFLKKSLSDLSLQKRTWKSLDTWQQGKCQIQFSSYVIKQGLNILLNLLDFNLYWPDFRIFLISKTGFHTVPVEIILNSVVFFPSAFVFSLLNEAANM